MEYEFNEQEQGDFYLTLVSNQSLQYFKNNHPYSFRNQLLRPINASPAFEVGLAEIHYSDQFKPKIEENPSEPVKVKFYADGENKIQVFHQSISKTNIKKEQATINAFVTEISFQSLSIFANVVKIDSQFTGVISRVAKTRIIIDDPSKVFTLEISKTLAEILGFDKTIFEAGEHIAENVQSTEAFDKLDANDILSMTLYKQTLTEVEVDEPDKIEIASVIENCIENLVKINFDVSAPFGPKSEGDSYLYIDIEGDLKIQFPKSVNRLLDLDDEYKFSAKRTPVKIPKIEEQEKSVLESRLDQILVLSTISDPILYGSTCFPILRIFPRKESESVEKYYQTFHPIYYIPLREFDAQSIQISLVNESFQYLSPEHTSVTTVVLHFRRRK
jgi:hypothetical protein